MTATFCLAASHHTGSGPGQKLLRTLLASVPEKPSVCYIGAAHGDSRDWAKVTIDFFKKGFGAHVEAPRLSDPKLDKAKAREAIETLDVLYMDGGDPNECLRLAREHGLAGAFKKAGKKAKLVYGLSAGAITTTPCTVRWDDEQVGHFAPAFDMGPPHPIDVHDEADDWPEIRILLELITKERPDMDATGVVIPTGAALLVAPDGGLSSYGKKLCERRRLGRGDSWKIDPIPAA